MKVFIIIFGLATILTGFLFVLYSFIFERGISFALKFGIGVVFFLLGGYLIYEGIGSFKKNN